MGLTKFLPFFLAQSALGGWDVALRAMRPSLPIDPGFIQFGLQLQTDTARVFFAWTVSLLPGTVSARLESDSLRIHVLTRSDDVKDRLQKLEKLIGLLLEDGRP